MPIYGVPTASGVSVFMEVDPGPIVPNPGVEQALLEGFRIMEAIAGDFSAVMQGGSVNSAEVEFGVKAIRSGTDALLYVSNGIASATFRVRLVLKREDDQAADT